VRLQVNGSNITFIAATAHFTWQGHAAEISTGKNPRREIAHNVGNTLQKLGKVDETIIFGGDLNDPLHPRAVLEAYGFLDIFYALNLKQTHTYPQGLSSPVESYEPEQALDFIFCNNKNIKPLAGHVVYHMNREFYYDIGYDKSREWPWTSDHWPVQAFYELNIPLTAKL